jgi:hypothetical protein
MNNSFKLTSSLFFKNYYCYKRQSLNQLLRMSTYKIVLVRHGESEWNLVNKFCGWHDADLSDKGIEEAKQAGKVFSFEFM